MENKKMKSEFLKVIEERGFINQCTDIEALDEKLCSSTPVVAYIGYDCTADSLHVGSLLTIMLLRWYQKCGHKPIVLMGGATTKVGDPTGKDESRKFLSDEAIAHNMEGIKKVFSKYLKFGDGPTDAVMVNNDDWLGSLKYMEFLRDYGRHFTINRMMTFDSVKMRLDREQPLTFLEFNYMILQGFDFLELNRNYGCTLQMGGGDQWGNIINGVELTRRVDGTENFGLTIPLITTSSGGKMGKSMSGAVWLNEEKLSAYDYWQFWRNTEDADVVRFLKFFTELSMEEVAKLAELKDAEINEAKKVLAFEATKLCHGEKAALEAAETARKVFEQGASGDNLPSIDASEDEVAQGYGFVKALKELGFCASNGEAKRLIKQGGARVNDEQIKDENHKLTSVDVKDGIVKISAGKKKHGLLKIA
jgi:tyrosyl-tRNA synthetase